MDDFINDPITGELALTTGQQVAKEMGCDHPGVDNTTNKCIDCGKPWKEVEAELMYKGPYNACEQCGGLVAAGTDLCSKCVKLNAFVELDAIPTRKCDCSATETCPICKDAKLAVGISPKHDAGKLMYSLIPPVATKALAEVLTFGAQKYAPNSWQGVEEGERRYLDALMRHLEAYRSGEAIDNESGLSHLSHAITNLAFLLHFEAQGNG